MLHLQSTGPLLLRVINYLRQLAKMPPGYTHKHSKGRELPMFILVFTSSGIMADCPFFLQEMMPSVLLSLGHFLPSPLTASFVPSPTSHTLYESLNLWPQGKWKSTAQGAGHGPQKDPRDARICLPQRNGSTHTHRGSACCSLTWLSGKRSQHVHPGSSLDSQTCNHSMTKQMPEEDPPNPPLPSAPSLFSSENNCKKIYSHFLADNTDF